MDRELILDIAARIEDGADIDEDEAAAAAKLLRMIASCPPPAQDWWPIATAPRDGREILVYRPGASPRDQIGIDWWRGGAWWRSRPESLPTHWRTLDSARPA